MKPNAQTQAAMAEVDENRRNRRLEQLLAEFEASLVPSFEEPPERYIEVQQALTVITNNGEITDSECHEICCRFPSYVLACRYIIARDYGVFDPKDADMLWKLQNGGEQ